MQISTICISRIFFVMKKSKLHTHLTAPYFLLPTIPETHHPMNPGYDDKSRYKVEEHSEFTILFIP